MHLPSEDGAETPDRELRCSGRPRPSVLAGTGRVSGVRPTAACLNQQTNGAENIMEAYSLHIGQEVHEENIPVSVFWAWSPAQIVALMDPHSTAHTITCSFSCRPWGGRAASVGGGGRETAAFVAAACQMISVTAGWRRSSCFPLGFCLSAVSLIYTVKSTDL